MRRVGVRATALLAGLALAGCAQEPPEPAPVIRPIKMLDIGSGAAGTREYPGRIRAGQQIDMGFEVPGRIIEFVYPEGARVKKGAVLARLDPSDYQNSLEQARAMAWKAKTYLDRIAQAYETRAVAEQDLTDAKAQVEVAEAEVRIQRKALEDTRLLAPFDGWMSRKLVEDFANVQAKQPVLVFEETSVLQIKVAVPERDMAGRQNSDLGLEELNERLRPEVIASALPNRSFPARLAELATTADPTTRTFQATFVFAPPAETVVLPGMTAKAIIHIGADRDTDTFEIPAQAVIADDSGRPTVWLVDPTSMAVGRQPVTLGELSADRVVVSDGLSAGDVVAVSGVAQLREGMVVRRWEP
jgi:RND family efflux transporter MFP subunit